MCHTTVYVSSLVYHNCNRTCGYVYCQAHSITITFRDGDMCTGETFADPLGDSVIVNKATSGFPVPITLSGAISAGWGKGGCIGGMGTHWSFDLAASYVEGGVCALCEPGVAPLAHRDAPAPAAAAFACALNSHRPLLSYNVSTLVPVTAMYESDTQAIGAILIQTSAIQEHIPAVGDWEGPFPPSLLYVLCVGGGVERWDAKQCCVMSCWLTSTCALVACCLLLLPQVLQLL